MNSDQIFRAFFNGSKHPHWSSPPPWPGWAVFPSSNIGCWWAEIMIFSWMLGPKGDGQSVWRIFLVHLVHFCKGYYHQSQLQKNAYIYSIVYFNIVLRQFQVKIKCQRFDLKLR